ncbi:hypothetical protein HK102_003128 [Quaeritorhiza haematococci]|nr:hypothetical protein HK102_003128 [Quaeritorhiza haematococci]
MFDATSSAVIPPSTMLMGPPSAVPTRRVSNPSAYSSKTLRKRKRHDDDDETPITSKPSLPIPSNAAPNRRERGEFVHPEEGQPPKKKKPRTDRKPLLEKQLQDVQSENAKLRIKVAAYADWEGGQSARVAQEAQWTARLMLLESQLLESYAALSLLQGVVIREGDEGEETAVD